MRRLRRIAATEARRLLRVLLLWLGAVSADARGSTLIVRQAYSPQMTANNRVDREIDPPRGASGLLREAVRRGDTKPLAASFVTGFIASLCCGGSIVFASVGLGALYSALGMWR